MNALIEMTDKISNTARATSKNARRLPHDFKLSENDVYVGRTNLYRLHPGNMRFNEIVQANVERYCSSLTRIEKTSIVHDVIDQVRYNSSGGGFVQQSKRTGQWYEVGDIAAREKTSKAFRQATIGLYKSSRPKQQIEVCNEYSGSKEAEWLRISNLSYNERDVPIFSNPNSYNPNSYNNVTNWDIDNGQSRRIVEDSSNLYVTNDRIIPPAKRSTFDDVHNTNRNTIDSSQLEFSLKEPATTKSDDRKLTPFELRMMHSTNANISGSESTMYCPIKSNNDIRYGQQVQANQYVPSNGLFLDLNPLPINERTMILYNAANVGTEQTDTVTKSDEETFDLLFKHFTHR